MEDETPRFREKLWLIFRATKTHARNLAKFATIYKTTCLLLKYYGATPGKEGTYYLLSFPPTWASAHTLTAVRALLLQVPMIPSSLDSSAATSSLDSALRGRARSRA